MKGKSSTTWKQLSIKAGSLVLSAGALGIQIVRKAGEDIGTTAAKNFMNDADSDHQRAKKVAIGRKTGSFVASILTLGMIGSYIVELDSELEGDAEQFPDEASPDQEIASATPVPVDINGDGVADGFDTDGDGLIDTNLNGVQLGELESVSGYTTESGRVVDDYIRTTADSTEENNLRV